MEQVVAHSVRVGGQPARVWRGGSGPDLLLLHGGHGDAQWHWRPIWQTLAESFEITAPDLPGFGETAALSDPSLEALVDWLGELHRVLDLGRVGIIGNSFGATLGRLFAARDSSRVARLMLVNGGLLTTEVLAVAQASLPGVATLAAASRYPAPRAQTPLVPTLVLWGAADHLTLPDEGRTLANEIPGALFQLIEGAGHLPQLERPDEFVNIVRQACWQQQQNTF
jgi:pimeloyl-ACP methyl ester carboxylesterase